MVNEKMIVKHYFYRLSNEENIDFEDYIRKMFEKITKPELKKYCNNNNIFYKSNFTKDMLIEKVYKSSNELLKSMLENTKEVKGESLREYYYRIYINF